jgi:pyruvate/2-oxoglutarate dehydrogenase complex dihydrolipoamide dehydrogenase (E3) component
MAERTLTPDLCVIGGGTAGIAIATGAAASGVPVVLVDRGPAGGSRMNRGGLPAWCLVAAARRARAIRQGAEFGLKPATPEIDFDAFIKSARSRMADLGRNESPARLRAFGIGVIEGEGRFVDANTAEAGDFSIRARRFVIASGTEARVPDIPGLADTPYFTSEGILTLDALPRELLVIGGGATGLALADAFHELGSKVTVLERDWALGKEDSEATGILLQTLRRKGIVIEEDVKVTRVQGGKGNIQIEFSSGGGSRTVKGTGLLLAAGWKQETDSLGLDAAGIAYDANGIESGRGLRTTNSRVYVIGGVHSPHAANYQAKLVLQNVLFRRPVKAVADCVPRVVFTTPEFAHVGMLESDAREQYSRVRVMRAPYRENERAEIEREGLGTMKLVTTRWGRILGATIVGPQASEQIAPFSLAVAKRMNFRAFFYPVIPHPTLAEIVPQMVAGAMARGLTMPGIRFIIRTLQKLG